MGSDVSANLYWYAYTIITKYALPYYRIYANDLSYYVRCLTFSDALEFFIIYTAIGCKEIDEIKYIKFEIWDAQEINQIKT